MASILAGVAVFALATGAFAEPDDRGGAEAALREIEASPRRDAVSEPVARAKAALERASRLRAAGDEQHARLADAAAKTWADSARELLRAIEIEQRAAAARLAATDAGARADRERALLEEGIAQSGRLRAQLEGLARESKEQPARTSMAGADGGVGKTKPATDGGAR